MTDAPFPGDPFAGIAPNLIPNPPAATPEAPEPGDAVAHASPFADAQDIDSIIKNLELDRPLKLFIPRQIMTQFPSIEFRIINSIPSEIAAANNKGFREITDPEATALFASLVAGTDKTGKAYHPLLYGRPKVVGDHVRKRNRQQLASLYAGMDPKNKDLDGKYTSGVDAKDGTKGQFTGAGFRIRV